MTDEEYRLQREAVYDEYRLQRDAIYEQRRYEIARDLLVRIALDHDSDRWKRYMAICVQGADDLLAELEKTR